MVSEVWPLSMIVGSFLFRAMYTYVPVLRMRWDRFGHQNELLLDGIRTKFRAGGKTNAFSTVCQLWDRFAEYSENTGDAIPRTAFCCARFACTSFVAFAIFEGATS